jgi:alkyldihydroxyacetonephosphate synthase
MTAMKWWGWGAPEKRLEIGPGAQSMLRSELGAAEPAERVALEEIALPEPRPLPDGVVRAAGDAGVLTGHEERVLRSGGKSYPDLFRMRSGQLESAPDAVVVPESGEQIAAILQACAAGGVAVVPFGGGTSVVGGVDPHAGPHGAAIALDLARLGQCEVDPISMTARLGPGLRGPEAEAALSAHGVTLGHFPQSFEYATVGGFAATRSAGQASSGYGRFDALVSSVRMLTPVGEISTLATPHSAAGPALREVAIGSEGVLGVIPEVTVRVRPAPAVRRYEAWMAESFEAGSEIVRGLAQGSGLPSVIRVSDEEETEGTLALSGPRGLGGRLFDRYLGVRGRRNGALLIAGFEGEEESVARSRALTVRALRAGGAAYLGQAAGKAWEHGRYQGPYLRDTLMGMGAMVETLETSHTWSRYGELHAAVGAAIRGALEAQGTPGLVFCHLSHAYADGASLYFTFISRARRGAELEQWAAVKRAACEAIVAHGGTITHHHAVGRDHAPYMEPEVGETGIAALRALKERLDPAGIMNPGKLLPFDG